MNTYKQHIDNYFNNNYDKFSGYCHNILKLISRTDLVDELVTNTYLHLTENESKLSEQIQGGNIEAVAVRWATMQIRWRDTQFKKQWVYPSKYESESEFSEVEIYSIIEDSKTEEEHLQYEKEIQDKMVSIHYTLSQLPLDQQLLFNDIYINGINTSGKLAKHTKLSRTNCHYMKVNLRNTLKAGYNKDK